MRARHLLAVGMVAAVLSGCGRHSEPNTILMPDMVYSPAFKAQELEAMRMPVKGTVPRGFQPYPYLNEKDSTLAGRELKNPLHRTSDVLARGKAMFNTYCIVCHGPNGEGDGSVVPKFPRPPSLQSDKVRDWADGNLYHVITMGQNLMPSYRQQIAAGDRWAIIHYVRALQRSKHPTSDDLKVAAQQE